MFEPSHFGSWGLLDPVFTFHKPWKTRTTISGPFFRLSSHNPALLFVHHGGSCISQQLSHRLSLSQARWESQVLLKPFWIFLLTLREFPCMKSIHSTEFFPFSLFLCLSFLCFFLLLISLCLLDVNYFQCPFSWQDATRLLSYSLFPQVACSCSSLGW